MCKASHFDEGLFILQLHFNNLSLSGAQPCEDAYVEILNGEFATSPSIGHFCGNTPPADFLSQTNQLRVIFHNNGISSPPRTFNLQFTSQAAGTRYFTTTFYFILIKSFYIIIYIIIKSLLQQFLLELFCVGRVSNKNPIQIICLW